MWLHPFAFISLNVHVIINMLLAVAVGAVALGAVTELRAGIIGVGLAADGAFVEIALFLIDRFGGFFEIDGLGGMLVLVALFSVVDPFGDISPEEDEEVKNSYDGEKGPKEITYKEGGDHVPCEKGSVNPGQPLHLDREKEHYQHLHIREEEGKGEKHGEVDIVHTGIAKDKTENDVEQDS